MLINRLINASRPVPIGIHMQKCAIIKIVKLYYSIIILLAYTSFRVFHGTPCAYIKLTQPPRSKQ